MRDKQLMQVVLGLNLALVAAVAAYFLVSQDHRLPPAKMSGADGASAAKTGTVATVTVLPSNAAPAVSAPLPGPARSTNDPVAAGTNATATAATVAPGFPMRLTPAGRQFGWEQVESPEYLAYLTNLRLCGCPEKTVRRIALDDINELFTNRRVNLAVAHDPQWWRPESYYIMSSPPRALQEAAQQLEADRRELITKLLGAEVAQSEKQENAFWTDVQLTGAVLGKLGPQTHAAVQAICRDSLERQETTVGETAQAGLAMNPVELARYREQTRVDLRRVLSEEEMFEFLVRYSQNASRLRDELRGFNPTADEFRGIFRALDPIDHALQLEYGGPEALSTNQRDRWQRQRDQAVKEVLSPERYEAFLLTKDPLYRQAQLYATQYGAPVQAVQPIYEMTKTAENKRQEIINDTRLTPQEKSQALQDMNLDQQRNIQRIVREVHERIRNAN